jgi:hypothetical protein
VTRRQEITLGKASRPRTDSERGGASPLLLIGGIAVVAFVVAILVVRSSSDGSSKVSSGASVDTVAPASAGPCGEGAPDPSYTMTTESDPNPPRSEGATFHLTVRHNGKAVTGAKVCVAANMPGMLHAGISSVATEASAGRYDTDLKFSMEGSWAGTVTVAEPGQPVVSIPLKVEVAPSAN